jgi:hypothetical protein
MPEGFSAVVNRSSDGTASVVVSCQTASKGSPSYRNSVLRIFIDGSPDVEIPVSHP